MHWFNGRLSQIPQRCIFLFVTICVKKRHYSSWSYIVGVELLSLNPRTALSFSGAPVPPCVHPIIVYLSISGAPDTRIAKEFRTFTESTMLNNLQSIAQENHYQLLNTPETDPALYNYNHPVIERLCEWYRVDSSYPKTWLAYSRLTRRIQPSISSLRNDVQAHLRSTLISSLMVSDLIPHAYSIQWPILTSCHSFQHLIPHQDPWSIHFAPIQAYFLPSWMLWICGCQHTHSVIYLTLNM